MNKFLQALEAVNGEINGVVWGVFGLLLLVGTGILVTALTRFFQVSHLGMWFKNTIGSLFDKSVIKHTKEKGSISPFQALCTAPKTCWVSTTAAKMKTTSGRAVLCTTLPTDLAKRRA